MNVCGHTERVEIVPPGVDVEEFRPSPRCGARRACCGRRRTCPARLRGVPRGRRADRPYFGEADREQGRPGACWRRSTGSTRAPSSSASATTATSSRGSRRRARCSRASSSTATCRHLLPLCDVAVVPSIFPEAFGMVAAEAAAAGVLPVVSAHSGARRRSRPGSQRRRGWSSCSRPATRMRCANASRRSSRYRPSAAPSWASPPEAPSSSAGAAGRRRATSSVSGSQIRVCLGHAASTESCPLGHEVPTPSARWLAAAHRPTSRTRSDATCPVSDTGHVSEEAELRRAVEGAE